MKSKAEIINLIYKTLSVGYDKDGLGRIFGVKELADQLQHQEVSEDLFKKCPKCDGLGYTSEHDYSDSHINGECSNCPIQVQCDYCEAKGFVSFQQQEANEKKLQELIDKWYEKQQEYELLAESTTTQLQHVRLKNKAVATRDCWKELSKIINPHSLH